MLDKFFGFMKIEDERSVLDTLIEHARIDEEELHLMRDMAHALCDENLNEVDAIYQKIRKINTDSQRIFEHTPDQIIHANFDHQKQYDLLRLYQRHESISSYIVATAKRIVIMQRINATLPADLHDAFKALIKEVCHIHEIFLTALKHYTADKKKVFATIARITEVENYIDHLRSDCLEILYRIANEKQLGMGDLRAIENTIEHAEDISDMIEETATSLEWLLL